MSDPVTSTFPQSVALPGTTAERHGRLPRGLPPLDTGVFTTHVACPRPRGTARNPHRVSHRWRPLVIATCVGALATLAGTAVWGFFPEDVAGSLSGLDRAIISLGTR